jgi:hypothetical protein
MACRLTRTETVRSEQTGSSGATKGAGQENAGTPHDNNARALLEHLIFTAGNPPEGQQ